MGGRRVVGNLCSSSSFLSFLSLDFELSCWESLGKPLDVSVAVEELAVLLEGVTVEVDMSDKLSDGSE